MLVLSRQDGESIVLDLSRYGAGIVTVKVVEKRGNNVRIGITAPLEIPVHREEVYEAIQRENQRMALEGIQKGGLA